MDDDHAGDAFPAHLVVEQPSSSPECPASSQFAWRGAADCYVVDVKLADRVAQCRQALTVVDPGSGRQTTLSGAANCASDVAKCPLRFVLSDDLTRLCAELAYSKGARNLACADLLHVPAKLLWVEWSNAPWLRVLEHCGFPMARESAESAESTGRRGALVRSSPDGRRGTVRTFWTLGADLAVLASSMEAYFDFDTPEGEEPDQPEPRQGPGIRVHDGECKHPDVLARCFRFRYERTWSEYYANAALSPLETEAVKRFVLGTIAIDMPVLLTFLLLLASRSSLPRHPQSLERLNRSRQRSGKAPLLDHIEVRAPVLPEYLGYNRSECVGSRLSPRLHHVRGHLMRRGSKLFWRVPHLRGSARAGAVGTRTVTWSFDAPSARVRPQVTIAALPPAAAQ